MDITAIRYTPPTHTKLHPAASLAELADSPATSQAERGKPIRAVETVAHEMEQQAEKARLEAIERVAQMMQKAFPEMETFTIFKNNSGEFITRITNRNTGTVQYVPEQNILQYPVGQQVYEDKMFELNV